MAHFHPTNHLAGVLNRKITVLNGFLHHRLNWHRSKWLRNRKNGAVDRRTHVRKTDQMDETCRWLPWNLGNFRNRNQGREIVPESEL